jgi:predicted nuclease of predicted toxin-antitoxin system
MRFAVDACVPRQLAEALTTLGADVTLAAGRPAMPDDQVLGGTVSVDRVLITADKDFGELVIRSRKNAVGVILIRSDIVSTALAEETAMRILALENHARGLFVVLERTNVRTRRVSAQD